MKRENKKDGSVIWITKELMDVLDAAIINYVNETGVVLPRAVMARKILTEYVAKNADKLASKHKDPASIMKMKAEHLQNEMDALLASVLKVTKEAEANEPF
ncbi:hypothetical protein [Aeromonas veronii]|uniref:hypothetical protein n=1 Tax=Aeromonas veronii TaxID=654 RepID=UPI001F462D66|nr:hypothetical protein [Aeromonas veronii]MCF5866722.1 hypothetical protein [Aeromonas veronii]